MLRYEDVVLADRPLIYYPLGDTAPRDLAGRGIVLQAYYGAGTWRPIPGGPGRGTGRRCNGNNNLGIYTEDHPDLDIGTAGTWEAWWYHGAGNNGIYQQINRDNVGSNRIFQWRVNARRINLILWPGAGQYYSSTWPDIDMGWMHLASTYDGANVRMYLDGKLDTVTARTGAVTAGNSGVAFLNDTAATGTHATGRSAHMAFYNRVLSPAQINRHYQAGMAGLRGAGVLGLAA